MDASRRFLVSKDIPLNRVGRLKSLFQLGRPIPVEELQIDSRLNLDGESGLKNGDGISEHDRTPTPTPTPNGDHDLDQLNFSGVENSEENFRINTAIVAKRFRSAKAIFDQIEQESRHSSGGTNSGSPVFRSSISKSKDFVSPSKVSDTSADQSRTDEQSPKLSDSPNGNANASANNKKESPVNGSGGRQRPLVTRPKPVLSPEQLRALQQRTAKHLQKSDTTKTEKPVAAEEPGSTVPAPSSDANDAEKPSVETLASTESEGDAPPVTATATATATSEEPCPREITEQTAAPEAESSAKEAAVDNHVTSKSEVVLPASLVQLLASTGADRTSECESDALDTVPSLEDNDNENEYEIDDEEDDANEVSYEEEDDEENLRDFEDNERRLTLEYRLEQLETYNERAFVESNDRVELHRLPDGNYYFDLPGLPSASRDGTIDAQADAAQINAAPTDASGKRRIRFSTNGMRIFSTYAPFEYDRRNEDIDPIGASAEYELEKRIEKMEVLEVELEKDADGLGISIVGMGIGAEAGIEKLGIFVKAIAPTGSAARDGRIKVCDQLIEVDSTSLVGVTQAFAAQVLRNTRGVVRFVVGREKDTGNSDIARLINLSLQQDQLKQQRLAQLIQAAQASHVQGQIQAPAPAPVQSLTPMVMPVLPKCDVDSPPAAPIATAEGDAEVDTSDSEVGDYDTQPSISVNSSMITSSVNVSSVSDSHYDNENEIDNDNDSENAVNGDADADADAATLCGAPSGIGKKQWNTEELGDAQAVAARFDELHARNVALEAELSLLRDRERERERDHWQSTAEQKLGELIQIKVSLELQLQLARDQLEAERKQFAERESQINTQLDLVTRKYKKVKRLYKELLAVTNTLETPSEDN